MTDVEFKALASGDVVRHVSHSEVYLVHANYGDYVIAVRVAHLTNPREWEVTLKSGPLNLPSGS